jgi:ESS family glutamate:Na+ symporter
MIELLPDRVLFLHSFLAVTTGILVLFVGKALTRRFRLLREYNIPEPVTGGLLFAIVFWLLYLASGYSVGFELTARDVLLVYFFTTIGIDAHISDLRAGGRRSLRCSCP